jgi:aldehyde:ferredoxin oxidoreductase
VNDGPYQVDARYGGPEYESLSALGSYCGVSDLEAVARANQLCNMYGMDTISCGATIAWAMDCFEQGLLTPEDTGGIELRFGNADALVEMVECIGEREGLGRVLGEGSVRAAEILGVGKDLVVAVKGQELPAHMPQVKRGLGFAYMVYPGGADHTVMEHDTGWAGYRDRMAELGLLEPVPTDLLNDEKVRYVLYSLSLISCVDSLCMCKFVFGPAWQLYGPSQMVEAVRKVTGWNISLWELMKAGQRRLNLMRAFNSREGVGSESDTVPPKLLTPLQGGPTDGVAITTEEMERARDLFYQMMRWDQDGHPTRAALAELDLGWLADELGL